MKRLLAVAVLLLVSPAVASEMAGRITFDAAFSSMTMSANMTISGEEAASIRHNIDLFGNGDGTASQEEVDRFLGFVGGSVSGQVAMDFPADAITMDGQASSEEDLDFGAVTIDGATGPITDQSALVMGFSMTIGLHPVPGDRHILVMRGNNTDAGNDGEQEDDSMSNMTGKLSIEAPAGYRIASHNAPAGSVLSGDKRILTLDSQAFTESEGEAARITFEPASKSSPGPTAAVALALVAAVAFLRRRL